MSGAITPHGWYRTLQTENGIPDWECIALLARLIHKHQRAWSERKREYVQQAGFRGGVFETSLAQLERWLCLQPEHLAAALFRLQSRDLIRLVSDDPELSTTFSVHLATEQIAAITTGDSYTKSASAGAVRPGAEGTSSESDTAPSDAPAAEKAGEHVLDSDQLRRDREYFFFWWRALLQEFGSPFQPDGEERPRIERMFLLNPDYTPQSLLTLAAWAWHMPGSASRRGYDPLFYCHRARRLPFFAAHVEDIAAELEFWDRPLPKKVTEFTRLVASKHRDQWQALQSPRPRVPPGK